MNRDIFQRCLLRRFVRRLVRCDRRGLHRRIDQLENNGCDDSGSEVGQVEAVHLTDTESGNAFTVKAA